MGWSQKTSLRRIYLFWGPNEEKKLATQKIWWDSQRPWDGNKLCMSEKQEAVASWILMNDSWHTIVLILQRMKSWRGDVAPDPVARGTGLRPRLGFPDLLQGSQPSCGRPRCSARTTATGTQPLYSGAVLIPSASHSAWFLLCFSAEGPPTLLSQCSQPRSSSLPKSKGGSRKPRGNPTFILQSSRGEWDDRCGSYMWDGDGSQNCQKHRGDITFRRKIFRVKGGHLVHPSASEQSRLKRYYGDELEVNLFRETDIAECRGENLSMQKMIKNKQAQVNFNWTATKQASCSSGFAETMEMSFLATLLPCPLGFSLGSPFD